METTILGYAAGYMGFRDLGLIGSVGDCSICCCGLCFGNYNIQGGARFGQYGGCSWASVCDKTAASNTLRTSTSLTSRR